MRSRSDVTLRLARENPPNSFYYERLENIRANDGNVPNLAEVGYEMSRERFVVQPRHGRSRMSRVEEFTKQFFEEVVASHFVGVDSEPVVMGNNDWTRAKEEVQRAAATHINDSAEALLLSSLGSRLKAEFGSRIGQNWFGTGSLSAFIREIVPTSGIQIDGDRVWAGDTNNEPKESPDYSADLPEFIGDIDSILKYFPPMGRECWQDTFKFLADYAADPRVAEREFEITHCTVTIAPLLIRKGHKVPSLKRAIGYNRGRCTVRRYGSCLAAGANRRQDSRFIYQIYRN